MLLSAAAGGVLPKIDVLAQRSLKLAARGKGPLVDGSIVLDAVRQCAEVLR